MTLGVVTADVPVIDDCPVLTRLKLFVVKLGMSPTLEHVLRDARGRPLDLSAYFNNSQSESTDATITLRLKEVISDISGNNPIQEIPGQVTDPAHGIVQFKLTTAAINQAGIYQLSLGLKDANDELLHIENPLLWVERSLYGTVDRTRNAGPPSIDSIRQWVMDHSRGSLLLDNVEFTDDQIGQAAVNPIRYWNEQPPPLRPPMDTRNFPFTEAWTGAIAGYLYQFAAAGYRRDHLPYNAGGIAIDDKNKEREYLTAAQLHLDTWRTFVTTKKYEINTGLVVGRIGSIYGGMFY